jgi:Tfp pilus assembly protein PilO
VTKQRIPKPAAIALVVVGLLVAGALGYFVLISPQRSDASALKTEIASVQSEITTRRVAQQNQPTTPTAPAIRAADVFRVTKAMPNRSDMPGVLLELNRIARDTGIRFESITPQDGADAGGFLRQPIDLVFEGNFYELSDFLYRVRTLVSVHGGQLRATGRLFTIRSLSFVEGERAFPQIKATLGVDAYVYGTGEASSTPAPAPAPGPAPATPAPSPTPAPIPPPTPPAAPAPAAQPAPSASAAGAS